MQFLPDHTFERNGRFYRFSVEQMAASEAEEPVAVGSATEGMGGGPHCLAREVGAMPAAPVTSLELCVTQTCNLRCVYCFGRGGEYGQQGIMTAEAAGRAVDWLLERSGNAERVQIRFFGGEPFLNFPVMQVAVAHARERSRETGRRVSFVVTTNASLLDDEHIAFLRDHDFRVAVSFDGPEQVQNANRPFRNGAGSYDVVARNISRLLSAMPAGRVMCRATLHGATDPAAVNEAARKLGFVACKLVEAAPSVFDRSLLAQAPTRVAEHWERQASELLSAIRERDPGQLRALQEASGIAKAVTVLLFGRRRRFFCGAGRSQLAVSAAGDLYPCHRFVGIKEHQVGSVWGDELRRDPYQQSLVAAGGACDPCWAKHVCGGGCLYEHFVRAGSVAQPAAAACNRIRAAIELAIATYCELSDDDRAFLKRASRPGTSAA